MSLLSRLAESSSAEAKRQLELQRCAVALKLVLADVIQYRLGEPKGWTLPYGALIEELATVAKRLRSLEEGSK